MSSASSSDLDEGAIRIHVTMPPGISLAKATRWPPTSQGRAEFPEVASLITELGRMTRASTHGRHRHEGDITFETSGRWPNGGHTRDVVRRLVDRFHDLPVMRFHVSQPIIESVVDRVFDVHSQW